MHVLTMEGLMGAGMNATLVDTPMRAAGEAERKGNKAAMEQALGYAGAVTRQAEAYQEKAARGMEKEAEEAKKAEEKRQEELREQRAAEKEAMEARAEKASADQTAAEPVDSLEVSEDGKRFSEESGGPAGNGQKTEGTISPEPGRAVYTEAGEIVPAEPPGGTISLSV